MDNFSACGMFYSRTPRLASVPRAWKTLLSSVRQFISSSPDNFAFALNCFFSVQVGISLKELMQCKRLACHAIGWMTSYPLIDHAIERHRGRINASPRRGSKKGTGQEAWGSRSEGWEDIL